MCICSDICVKKKQHVKLHWHANLVLDLKSFGGRFLHALEALLHVLDCPPLCGPPDLSVPPPPILPASRGVGQGGRIGEGLCSLSLGSPSSSILYGIVSSLSDIAVN